MNVVAVNVESIVKEAFGGGDNGRILLRRESAFVELYISLNFTLVNVGPGLLNSSGDGSSVCNEK